VEPLFENSGKNWVENYMMKIRVMRASHNSSISGAKELRSSIPDSKNYAQTALDITQSLHDNLRGFSGMTTSKCSRSTTIAFQNTCSDSSMKGVPNYAKRNYFNYFEHKMSFYNLEQLIKAPTWCRILIMFPAP
jgi:hypothetical protein